MPSCAETLIPANSSSASTVVLVARSPLEIVKSIPVELPAPSVKPSTFIILPTAEPALKISPCVSVSVSLPIVKYLPTTGIELISRTPSENVSVPLLSAPLIPSTNTVESSANTEP